jgi:hypothetical protein
VFVVVPRHVRASDARFARDSLEKAGYTCRVGPSPLQGYVLAEFAVALQREERAVAAAFEIEVDDLLRGSRCPDDSPPRNTPDPRARPPPSARAARPPML